VACSAHEHTPESLKVRLVSIFFFEEIELPSDCRFLTQREFEKANADIPQCVHGIASCGFGFDWFICMDSAGWLCRCGGRCAWLRQRPGVQPDALAEDVGAAIVFCAKFAGPLLPYPDVRANVEFAVIVLTIHTQLKQVVSRFPTWFGPVGMGCAGCDAEPVLPISMRLVCSWPNR
jgi:hypothetical protein